MVSKATLILIIILVLAGVAKASHHFIKLVLLLAVGLGGVYLLNQSGGLPSLPNLPSLPSRPNILSSLFKRSIPDDNKYEKQATVDFSSILKNDPFGCALRFVCRLAAKSLRTLAQNEKNILSMVRSGSESDFSREPFLQAVQLGRRTRNPASCKKMYNECPYSTTLILKLLRS